MTVVLAAKTEKGVYFISDTCVSTGWTQDKINTKMLFCHGFTFGISGSIIIIDTIRFLSVPALKRNEDPHKWLATKFIPKLREAFKAMNDSSLGKIAVNLVASAHGRLFSIGSDLCIQEAVVPYVVVGCGAPYALGAFVALEPHIYEVRDRAIRAIEIACENSIGCSLPYSELFIPD